MRAETSSLPRDVRRPLLVYNLLFPFVFIALVPGLLRRMIRRGNFREKFSQRFARYSADEKERFSNGRWIWIHSISVGETRISLKLAHALRRRDPALRVVISVTTSTGYAIAHADAPDWIEVIYNPIDLRAMVRHALDLIRPIQLIFVEGEIWPNLASECSMRGIPMALVDARLSPRSERRMHRFRAWTAPIFNLLDTITLSDESEVARWVKMGIDPGKIHQTGSIKFDEPITEEANAIDNLRKLVGVLGIHSATPVLLGGSTWEPEEVVLAEITRELRTEHPDLVLILVPRHVERCPEISRALARLKFRVQLRSALSAPHAPTDKNLPLDILLVDVTGELRDWYKLATVVFVGKSLDTVGGHNPAEPAFHEKPILFGPHMENFASLVQILLETDAARQVGNGTQLKEEIRLLLADPQRRDALGARARNVVLSHQGATERAAVLLLTVPRERSL